MKDTIYLTADKDKIKSMGKTKVPKMHAGERAFKVKVEIPDSVFSIKTINVKLESPYTDFDPVEDVNMKDGVITEEEKREIVEKRVEKLNEELGDIGYEVREKEGDGGDA